MNADPPTHRACPYCNELISLEAKVCPRCRQWLTWRSLRNPLAQSLFVVLPLMLGCGALLVLAANRFQRVFLPRPFYSEVPGALAVRESWLNWVETTNGPRIYVTGILTNRSDLRWRDIEFECRFADSSGRMVDAAHGRTFMTVPARDDAAFRVAVTPGRPSSADYHSHEVRVTTARSSHSAF